LFKVLFVILIVAIVILLTYHVTRQSQRLKLQKVKRNQELAELRLASIRSQLEPHFVFNVLNSIGYAIRANETDMAYDHLTKFSNLMRKWLKSAEEPMLTLKSELSLVRDYLDLEKFRFEERLNYSIEISELVPMDMMVPRMIIQIPVENAVKHGISNQVSGGKLLIKIDPEGDGIRILVQDNGVSREEAAKRTSAGNTKGLKLMEKLLDHIKLYHHYKVSLKVIDLYDENQVPCGTAVETIIK
jgi:LytS/YehU family sensor histidine kinase